MSGSPTLTIGITGHRPNRMFLGAKEIARRLLLVLASIRSGTGGGVRLVALSALAEGSDRLFAESALALGYQLEVILPFTSADYETTFGDTMAIPHFRELLGRAANVTELSGRLEDRTGAYEAAGQMTVSGSDILVTVWDGQAAAGRGGTPEIIEHAMKLGKPVIWIHAAHIRLPRLIVYSKASGAPPSDLERIAPRAKPLTRRRLATLAALLSEAAAEPSVAGAERAH